MTMTGNSAGAMLRALLIAAAVLVLAGCSVFRSAEYGMTRFTFTPEAEASMGTQFSQEIEKEYPVLDDAVAKAWVERVGASLAEHSPPTAQQFRFQVTRSPEVNAFAIPGGFCYVNIGLILYADNEAQVVAVVGHEINHVTARHGLRNLQRKVGVESLSGLAASQLPDARAAAAASIAAQAGGYLALQRFSRDDEREADRLGVDAMYGAGWDPREAARFFEKLNALHGSAPNFLTNLMSTHPATPERVQNINQQIAAYDLMSTPLTVDSPEFQAMKARLEALYGDEVRAAMNGGAEE